MSSQIQFIKVAYWFYTTFEIIYVFALLETPAAMIYLWKEFVWIGLMRFVSHSNWNLKIQFNATDHQNAAILDSRNVITIDQDCQQRYSARPLQRKRVKNGATEKSKWSFNISHITRKCDHWNWICKTGYKIFI